MFEGFSETYVSVGALDIFVRHSEHRHKPALLLMHGYPQTSAMWEHVAPSLAQEYFVVCPDLRGYGRSSKPASDPKHLTYSKREMARDMVAVMDHFGCNQFLIGAHDRGARVAHRLCLDAPDRVAASVFLDIAPTREMYANAGSKFAQAYWHWYFLTQPHPIPEQMIENDPRQFWLLKCINQSKGVNPFSDAALAEYLECFDDPAAIHASCEDYRAAATIDIDHDDADAGRKLTPPLKVIWAETGAIGRCFDPLDLWRQRAQNVEGEAVRASHYMAEEVPEKITKLMRDFFARHTEETVQ